VAGASRGTYSLVVTVSKGKSTTKTLKVRVI
jgi:hypothetical protein